MIGFDSIGQGAIGELSGAADTVIFAPVGFVVTVTKSAPAVSGGGSVLPAARSVSVTTAAAAIRISATIATGAAAVTVSTSAPSIQADAARISPSAAAVAVTPRVPLVASGKVVTTTSRAVTVTVSAPMVTAGKSISPPTAQVAVAAVRASIVGGNYVDARNTILMSTPYGEIGSVSIGQFAIGEGETSTRTVLRSPLVIVATAAPLITAGKSVSPTARTVVVSSARAEIGARRRPLRVLAIAS